MILRPMSWKLNIDADIMELVIDSVFKLASVLFVAVSTAALLTWERSRQNSRDLNAAFTKIRDLEDRYERRKETVAK